MSLNKNKMKRKLIPKVVYKPFDWKHNSRKVKI